MYCHSSNAAFSSQSLANAFTNPTFIIHPYLSTLSPLYPYLNPTLSLSMYCSSNAAFSSQSLANAFNGLAKMGISWTTDVPNDVQTALPERAAALARQMRPDELCSLLQSMALMKVRIVYDNMCTFVHIANTLSHTPLQYSLLQYTISHATSHNTSYQL